MKHPPRRAVIVLGMHRSGTSAVAGTAVRLGLAPPLHPLPAAADNPSGFHESMAVVGLNHLLLRAAGCDWPDCLSFSPDLLDSAACAAAFNVSRQILRQEFPGAQAFLMKDPRLCLTLPAWLPALHAVGAAVSVLLVVRHPEEVVRSLSRRDGLPEAVTAPLWLHHMLEAERVSRPFPRAIVFYDDLMRDWRGCMARAGRDAKIVWPMGRDGVETGMGDVPRSSLRHHAAGQDRAAVGPPLVRDLIADTWRALRALQDRALSSVARANLDMARVRLTAWRARGLAEGGFGKTMNSGSASSLRTNPAGRLTAAWAGL